MLVVAVVALVGVDVFLSGIAAAAAAAAALLVQSKLSKSIEVA